MPKSTMQDQHKTKEQLISELIELRKRRARLEEDRVSTEHALRSSSERFRRLVETVRIIPWEIDLARWQFTYVGPQGVSILGYPLEDWYEPHFWLNRAHPDDRAIVEQRCRQCSSTGADTEFEYRMLANDDSVVWMHGLAGVIPIGLPQFLQGFMLDITEGKLSQEKLRQTEERLRVALKNSPVILAHADRDLRYTWAYHNRGDFSPERILGKRDDEFMPPREAAELQTLKQSVLTTGVGARKEITFNMSSGVTVFDITAEPLRSPGGEIVGVTIAGTDVTDRKRAEEALQQAQKLESLGVLAGGIAHDFNNILVAILGNAGLALMGLPPGAPARDKVVEIEKAAARASELTNQMLAYAGKAQVDVRPLDLSSLVDEMRELLDSMISKRAVLDFALADDLPSLEGDAVQIRQVVMNLITNASEALDDKPGVVKVSTGSVSADRDLLAKSYLAEELKEGRYVYVTVSDPGIGMDEATKQKIFDPFFTTKFAGRGLGLAAVLGIVRSHGGSISVDTALESGTTFTVLFPITGEHEEPIDRSTIDVREWHGEGTILVVDDEEVVRSVLGATLEKWGFDVLIAADGEDAVTTFRDHASDVRAVLLDMTMPLMSGEEALAEIHRIRSDVPVILLSGYAEEEAVTRFEGLHLAGFLHKPFRPAALIDTLHDILDPDDKTREA